MTDSIPGPARMVALLAAFNGMTFAWYGQLRTLGSRPCTVAALLSGAIALFEYLQVPGKRIGYTSGMTLARLKIVQEGITPVIVAPFAVFLMRRPLRLDFPWVAPCIVAAIYFVFRGR